MLKALVRPPRDSAQGRAPLLALLHGVGSNEYDLFGLADHFDPRFFVASLRAPYSLGPSSHAWFALEWQGGEPVHHPGMAESSREELLATLPALVVEHALDPAGVYVCGFSQGAIMGTFLTLTAPEAVAGLVAMSGRVLPEAVEQRAPDERLRGKPVLWVHGRQDPVLPIRFGRDAQRTLSALPLDLEYDEFDMAHQVSQASLARVTGWLTERLSTPPR